jgi:superfamily II DNA or RNA helicase
MAKAVMKLRDYQSDILEQVKEAAINRESVIVQCDTGAGKTPIEAALTEWAEYSMIVAHRVTLIRQISEKMAAFGLLHDTVSTEYTRRQCAAAHTPHGKRYIKRHHAKRLAVSVDSLHAQIKRGTLGHIDKSAPWLIIIDEAHHCLPDNKWGALKEFFPNAVFVGFTATPARMDGESLHVDNGGLFERLIQAESLKENSVSTLIERGYLADFVTYASPKNANLAIDINGKTGLSPLRFEDQMVAEMLSGTYEDDKGKAQKPYLQSLDYESGELTLDADPIKQYQKLAAGTQAILMAPAIRNAEEFAKLFREAGIAAAAIHSTMPRSRITRALDAFAKGKLKVLCNVDMIGEGFDMPAVTTLIIATITKSFPRYRQWVGRVLRPAPGKERAIIIDLTRMAQYHGQPDDAVTWDLLNPPCGPKEPYKAPCDECGAYYSVRKTHCPECGAENEVRKGKPLGSFLFEIKYLNSNILASARNEAREEAAKERRNSEVIWPAFYDSPGLMGEIIKELRQWHVASLQKVKIKPSEINDFLDSDAAKGRDFWMSHFTAKDVGSKNTKKAKEAHQLWLNSR